MARTMKPLPSLAQAKCLASAWANGEPVKVRQYVDPTVKAMQSRGWIADTGKTERFASGVAYRPFIITHEGIEALTRFFVAKRRAHPATGG